MDTPEEAKQAEEGTEPHGALAVTQGGPMLGWFGRTKRWMLTKFFNTLPVDPASMVYFGIKELRIGTVLLEAVPYSDNWTLHDNLKVTWIDLDGNQEVEFLAGMETDLASIPRLLWRVIPPHRNIKRPAVFHDGLYHTRPFLLAADGVMKRIDRGKADKLLYVAMRAEHISKETSNDVYVGVRIGGGAAWHQHDEYFAGVDAAAILVRDAATASVAAETRPPPSPAIDAVSATGDPASDGPAGVVRVDGSDTRTP